MSSMNDRPSTDNNAGKDDDDVQLLPGHQGMEEDEEEDSHCCGKCQKTFNSLELYLQHKLKEHKYSVRYNKSSTTRMVVPQLYDHKIKRPPGRPRKDQSERKTPKAVAFHNKRIKTYHPEAAILDEQQGYNCEKCGKSFRRGAALRRHIEYDHAEKGSGDEEEEDPEVIDLDDDDGDVEFKTEDMPRKRHTAVKKEIELKQENRGIQGQGQSEVEGQIEGHIEGHIEEQTEGQIEGQFEGQISTQEELDLNQVTKVVTNVIPGSIKDRPYLCRECGRRFKEFPVLRAHMLTHSDARDFKCTFEGCPYAFKTKGSLKRHMRRHTDDRPFRCELCDRTFRESGALTRHLKSRTLCTNKTNADLPRYGKQLPLEQFPRHYKSPKGESSCFPALAPGEIPLDKLTDQAVVVQEGDQISVQIGDSSVLNADNILSVMKEDGGETVFVVPQEAEYDPNQCKACGAMCEDVESLEKHLKEHLIHLPFRCGLCSFAVATKEKLNAHMKASHNTELPMSATVGQNQLQGELESTDDIINPSDIGPEEMEGVAMTLHQGENDFGEVVVMNDLNADDMTVTVDTETMVTEEVAMETDVVENIVPVVEQVVGEPIPQDMTEAITQEHSSNVGPIKTVHMIIENVDEKPSILESQFDDEDTRDTTIEQEIVAAAEENETIGIPQDLDDGVTDQVNAAANVALKQLIHILKFGNGENAEDGEPQMKAIPTVHKCSQCGRCFENTDYLTQHMKIHETRPFTCKLCNKSFYTKEVLARHVQMHGVDKRYECGECGKLFKRIGAVKEHFKCHSNDRPFPCSVCGKAFKSANARKVHLRTHTNYLPYSCEYCTRSFREKSSLERHVRVHTGERPFCCPHCDKKFGEHGTLARHLRAKIPCSKRLEEFREMKVRLQQAKEQSITPLVPDEDGYNYIIQTEAEASDAEDLEYVMLTDQEAAGGIQNIEIITDGQEGLDMSSFPPGTELVLVNSDGSSGTVTMINPETGQEFSVLQSNIEEPVTIVDSGDFDSDIHSIAMVPDVEDHVETVAMDLNQIEAVAMAPDDTVQQAMIAADVQVTEGEVIL